MNLKRAIFISLFFIGLTGLFFYKTVLYGNIPFPGDLLIAEYTPWKSYSYFGYNPGSFPNKAQYFDVIRQIYPWNTFAIQNIKNGIFPLWNPYNFSGSPLFANSQSAVLYPLHILYFLLPQVIAWTILVLLQPLLSGIFMYLYTRKIGISLYGALLSSVAFSYSLFTSVFLEYNTIVHTFLWLPLSLYAIEQLLFQKKIRYYALFSISIIMIILAGHFQIAGYTVLFIFLYGLIKIMSVQDKKQKIAQGIFLFMLFVLSIGICAVQLLPTFELIQNSARSSQEYQFLIEKLLLQPNQLILFLSPDFFGNPATKNYLLTDSYPGNAVYIGFIPFLFALHMFFLKKNIYSNFFLIFGLVLLALIVRSPFTEIFYSLNVPFFSTGSPSNILFLLIFSLSILCGFGVEGSRSGKSKTLNMLFIIIGFLFVFLWLVLPILKIPFSKTNFLYSALLFGVFLFFYIIRNFFVKTHKLFLIFVLLLTVLDLFYFFQKFNPFVKKEAVFPPAPIFEYLQKKTGYNRIWGYGGANSEPNFTTQYRLFSPDGYDPLYPKIYGEFIQSSKEGKITQTFTNQTRSDAFITHGNGSVDLPQNKYRLRVLDTMGVKYILDRVENGSIDTTFPNDRFSLLYDKDRWRIFENKKALPRVFLATDYKIYKNNKEFESIFFSNDFNLQKTILLNESVGDLKNADLSKSSVSIASYTSNSVFIQTKTQDKALLFLSDTYFPGWRAYVNGKETKIYKADYAFRSIIVPQGNHTIRFKYQPESFSLGIKVTILSIVGLLILFVARKKYEW